MSSRLLPALVALLLGVTLGWGLHSCGADGERSDGSWEAVAGWSLPRSSGDSTLAVEARRWRAEAEASAARAESLAVEVRQWEAEAEMRRQAWAEARQRLDERDEVRDELERVEPDSLGALAGAVLRRRLGGSPVGR